MNIWKRLISFFGDSSKNNHSDWEELSDKKQIAELVDRSRRNPQLLYKHSNRCSVCWFAREQLEKHSLEIQRHSATMNLIDVIQSREVSNEVVRRFGIRHESPQVLIIYKGKPVWNTSHSNIKGDTVLEVLANLQTAV